MFDNKKNAIMKSALGKATKVGPDPVNFMKAGTTGYAARQKEHSVPKVVKGVDKPSNITTSKLGQKLMPKTTLGNTAKKIGAFINTKTPKNAAGELINPTKKDISNFNKRYTTYTPKQ